MLVAFNPQTADEDLASRARRRRLLLPDEWKFRDRARTMSSIMRCRSKNWSRTSGADAKLRDYVANMVYVGALAELLGIELDEIKAALSYHFKGKQQGRRSELMVWSRPPPTGRAQNLHQARPLPRGAHERDRRARS